MSGWGMSFRKHACRAHLWKHDLSRVETVGQRIRLRTSTVSYHSFRSTLLAVQPAIANQEREQFSALSRRHFGNMSIPKRLLDAKYRGASRPQGDVDDTSQKHHGKLSTAILDDYAGIAAQIFEDIPGLHIDTYKDTIGLNDEDGLARLTSRLQPYTIVSSMRERTAFPSTLIKSLPNLKLLLTTGIRNASIDLAAASEQGIMVTGTVGARSERKGTSVIQHAPPGFDSTTQQTWALLLSLCSRIPRDNAALRAEPSAWQSGFTTALGGKTMAILGLGRLGANTARIAVQAFGMNVIAWSENLTQDKADAAAHSSGLAAGTYRAVSKEELFRNADVLSLHYVLSDRSRGIVGAQELAMLKSTSMIVNTARAALIDEDALMNTLQNGLIRGAALDVWWHEPLPANSPWRSYKGKSELVMSPHMGYVNDVTMRSWYEEQAEIVKLWMAGKEPKIRLN